MRLLMAYHSTLCPIKLSDRTESVCVKSSSKRERKFS